MRKQIWKQWLCAVLAAGSIMGLLTGCGEEQNVDYSIDGIEEGETEERMEEHVGKSAVSQFANETVWSESWTVDEGVEAPVNITVKADILLPDAEEMSVVEVTVPEFDGAFKEHVSKTLFGDGAVYYNDVEYLPKKELEKLYADEKENYENATTESSRQIIQLYLDKYEKLLEAASDTYTLADTYEENSYIGEIDGANYELYFGIYSGETGWDYNVQYFNFYVKDVEKIRPEKYVDYVHYMEHPYMTCDKYTNVGENECNLSPDEAEELARNLLEDLGLEQPVLAYTKPIIWGDATLSASNIRDWPANGYVFNFEYGVDNVSFPGFGTSYEYTNLVNSSEDEIPQYSSMATSSVYVTDKGVIGLFVHSPVETVNISESVELLPLDTIKEIMKEEMTKNYEDFRFVQVLEGNELEFTHMELIYFRVSDKENQGCYSYIPAWRLAEQIGDVVQNNRMIRNPVVINAIDGSVISIYEEM